MKFPFHPVGILESTKCVELKRENNFQNSKVMRQRREQYVRGLNFYSLFHAVAVVAVVVRIASFFKSRTKLRIIHIGLISYERIQYSADARSLMRLGVLSSLSTAMIFLSLKHKRPTSINTKNEILSKTGFYHFHQIIDFVLFFSFPYVFQVAEV